MPLQTPNTTRLPSLVHSDELLSGVVSAFSASYRENARAMTVLAAAYKHLATQQWVANIVINNLGANLLELGRLGGLGHPQNIPQGGKVPNLANWQYFFHGRGCCLTCEDGTSIDVDFPDGRADIIDTYFFSNYLQSLPSPPLPFSRLVDKKPSENSWMAELPKLKNLGFISGDQIFEIIDAGKHRGKNLVGLWQAIESTDNIYAKAHAALLLEDYVLALKFIGSDKTSRNIDRIQQLAANSCEEYFSQLMNECFSLKDRDLRNNLEAAAALGETYTRKVIDWILKRNTYDAVMLLMIDMMESIGAKQYETELIRLIKQSWRARPPQPAIRVYAVKSLMGIYSPSSLPNNYRSIFIKALKKRLDRMGDEAAKQLYLLDKKLGLKLLADTLKNGVPYARDNAAVALAVIGTTEAENVLEKHSSLTTRTILAIKNNIPIAKVEPFGQEVEIEGRAVRTYSFDDIEMANKESFLRGYYEEALTEYRPLLTIWE